MSRKSFSRARASFAVNADERRPVPMIQPRVWFITGASSGFGRYVTELALERGDSVVATLRKPEALEGLSASSDDGKLLVLKVDVRIESEIANAFEKAKEKFGMIDVVFNNAGWAIGGEVEGTPEVTARDLFDTNFWGAVNVSKHAVRFFREVNPPGVGGRLLQMSSIVGLGGLPLCGFYSASKHALEGMTESLVQELEPSWNIKVTLIEPGAFRTLASTFKGNMLEIPAHPAYVGPTMMASMVREGIRGLHIDGDPKKAVQAIYNVTTLADPPLRLLLGKDCIANTRAKVKRLVGDIDKYEAWSDGLDFNAKPPPTPTRNESGDNRLKGMFLNFRKWVV